MQTDRFKITKLTVCLEDVLEWMQTGAVNGVHYDEQGMINNIKDILRDTGSEQHSCFPPITNPDDVFRWDPNEGK